MNTLYKYIAVVIFSLFTFGCEGAQVEVVPSSYKEEMPACLKPICEVTMSKVLSETAANAQFGTGLTYPTAGESGSIWWDLIEDDVQQLADRSQALQALTGVTDTNTRVITVPLTRMFDPDYDTVSTTWIRVISSGSDYWNGPSGGDTIHFEAPALPIGAKITSVYAYLNGNGVAGLPSPMPTLTLTKNVFTVGGASADTTVGSQADTTTVLATYNLVHLVTIASLTEVITDDASYRITLATSGSNSNCLLHGIRIAVSLP